MPVDDRFGIAGFIDVETTGLDPLEHEVIEFSIVVFQFNRETGEILEIIDEYTGQREPNRSIPQAATAVHGLTKRALKGKTLDINRIVEFGTECDLLIAHNAQFDRGFVRMHERPWYCSMRGVGWKSHGFKSLALQKLLEAHQIDPGEAHRASSDVHAAIALLSCVSPKGTTYFKELLDNGPMYPAVIPVQQEIAAATEPESSSTEHTSDTSQASPKESIPKKAQGCAASLIIAFMIPASLVFLSKVV